MDRAQAHTLEGFAAALLLLASVTFALDATAVTPLSSSTSNQHLETQEAGVTRGLLDAAVANGSLHETARYWNNSSGRFHNASDDGYYARGGPPTTFGAMLNRTFDDRGYAFDVNLYYHTESGERRRLRLVNLGGPSDHAVSVRRTVSLYDDDALLAADGSETGTTLASSSTFYAPDASPASPLYNVVTVEVVVWQM